jgi:hypothetical protein
MNNAVEKRIALLERELEQAQIGYHAAIEAMPFMPTEARPYTSDTADHYLSEIHRLEELIEYYRG